MTAMTSLERVLTTLSHQEPDRVPFFLLLTMHGAKELGLTIQDYFSKAENVVEGQMRLRAKYRHDCLYAIFYAPIEVAAWGGEVIFRDDGPPNSGEPFIHSPEEIKFLEAPSVSESPHLQEVLRTINMLKTKVGDEAPVVGVVVSPFSLPVMQMGFDRYLDLIYEQPDAFAQLMRVNQSFCVDWANAQFAAGATAIAYFDPLSSPTIVPRDLYLKTGFPIAKRVIAQFKGPVAFHLASGRTLPIIDDLVKTGAVMVGVSATEDLVALKAACQDRLAILGNLNGIEMRRWTPAQAEAEVKAAIAQAGPGGGFVLADNHGEIPWQVSDDVLWAISEAVHKWGRYPLNWIAREDGS